MSLWPFLLRALLSVSLILNGFANAAASTHMPIAHAAGLAAKSQLAEKAMTMADGSCGHERQSDMSASAPGKSAAASGDATSDKFAHIAPDCCDSSACSCACAHQAQATIAPRTLRNVPLEHPRDVRRLQPSHASPALPHLIRPPIG